MSKFSQRQLVSKQLSDIVESYQNREDNPDLKQGISIDGLLEKCVDSDPTLSDASCNAVVYLVSAELVNISHILHKFLNFLHTARNTRSLLLAVRSLLCIQLEKQKGLQYCILQGSEKKLITHPLIQILQSRPDTWNSVFEIIKYIFLDTNRPVLETWQFLEPVLRFVVWNPNKPDEWQQLNLLLTRFLWTQCVNNGQAEPLMTFMKQTMFWIKIKTPQQVTESHLLLQEISEAYCRVKRDGRELDAVILNLMAISVEMLNHNMDISSCLRTMLNLADMLKDEAITRLGQSTILLLGLLMQCAPTSYQKQIILLCIRLCGRDGLNPIVAYTVLPPLLGVMLAPSKFTARANKYNAEAAALRQLIEQLLTVRFERHAEELEDFYAGNFAPSTKFAVQIVNLLNSLPASTSSVLEWLEDVKEFLNAGGVSSEISYLVFNFVCGIFLHGLQDLQTVRVCGEVAVAIVTVDPSKVPDLIPVLLYKMNREQDPDVRLSVLRSFPRLAISKVHVATVLNIIQALSAQKGLEAVAIRLMLALWKRQDRIFPQLQKLLMIRDTDLAVRREYGLNEILVAKAVTICEICKDNPRMYGVDLLPTLSKIISASGGIAGEVGCALALEGIITLCKAEIIDLQTTWKVLAPKLKSDKRVKVLIKICELLSLATSLRLLNTQYEKFLTEVMTLLWKHTTHPDPDVISAAFSALGTFKPDVHLLKFFPQTVKDAIKVPSELIATPFDKAKKPEELLSYVPGSCYVHMMTIVPRESLSGYASLLQALVRHEVRDMPRGISYAAELRASRSSSSSDMDQIRPVLMNYFQRNQNPSAQGGVAIGALLVYEPENQDADRDVGYINSGREYKQVLDRLLVEVPFDASDWRRTVVLGPAWQLFMGRAYITLVEGRRAELKLQHGRGMLECSAEEYVRMQDAVWLYVRDKLTEVFRSAFRGRPAVQGNSVLALAGLVVAVAEFESLDEKCRSVKAEGTTHLSHGHWTKMVIESLLCLVDDGRDPHGRTFTWCHATSQDTNAVSSLPKASAALALPQLASVFASMDYDYVKEVMDILKVKLLTSLENPLMQFTVGISIGLLVQGLVRFRFLDLAGDEGRSVISDTVNFLSEWCEVEENCHVKVGPLVGLSLAVSAIASDTEFREIVIRNLKMIATKMQTEKPSSNIYEVLHVCNAIVTLAACHRKLVTVDVLEKLFADVRDKCLKSRNNIDLATALGLICSWKSQVIDKEGIFNKWITVLTDKDGTALSHLFAVYGLLAVNNLGRVLNLFADSFRVNDASEFAKQTVKQTMNMMQKSSDGSFINCIWILGCYHQRNIEKSKLPSSYHYLGNKSILRYVVEFVTKYEKSEGNCYLEPCLKCLAQDFDRSLPPLDWDSVLAPLLALDISPEVENLVVDVALKQSRVSPAAAGLVNRWLYMPSFSQLQKSSRIMILKNLPALTKLVNPRKLRSFLDKLTIWVLAGKNGCDEELAKHLLEGITGSLKLTDPPVGVTAMLFATVDGVYALVSSLPKSLQMLLCDTLMELPTEELQRLVCVDGKEAKHVLASFRVICAITARGKRPLSSLQPHVEAISTLDPSEHDSTLDILHQHLRTFVDPTVSEADRITWIIELMGSIKNCLQWKSHLKIGAGQLTKQASYLLKVFATSVVCWSSADMALTWHPHVSSYGSQALNLFPAALPTLLRKSPWTPNSKKVIDWTVALLQEANVDEDVGLALKSALLQTRNAEEFKKMSVWTSLL